MSDYAENALWNIKATSKFLDISEKTLRSLVMQREIPCLKVGRQWRFRPTSVRSWVKRREDVGKDD